MSGFVNDGTGTNPGDPSSMKNIGHTRNSIYNIVMNDLPDGKEMVRTKVPPDWNNKGPTQN